MSSFSLRANLDKKKKENAYRDHIDAIRNGRYSQGKHKGCSREI